MTSKLCESQRGLVECTICHVQLPRTRWIIEAHLIKSHTNSYRPFSCNQCGETFPHLVHLNIHLLNRHQNQPQKMELMLQHNPNQAAEQTLKQIYNCILATSMKTSEKIGIGPISNGFIVQPPANPISMAMTIKTEVFDGNFSGSDDSINHSNQSISSQGELPISDQSIPRASKSINSKSNNPFIITESSTNPLAVDQNFLCPVCHEVKSDLQTLKLHLLVRHNQSISGVALDQNGTETTKTSLKSSPSKFAPNSKTGPRKRSRGDRLSETIDNVASNKCGFIGDDHFRKKKEMTIAILEKRYAATIQALGLPAVAAHSGPVPRKPNPSRSFQKQSTASRPSGVPFYISQKLQNQSKTCKLCHRRFANRYTLKTHMYKHTGELRINCKFCPKKFSKYYDRIKHVNRDHYGRV